MVAQIQLIDWQEAGRSLSARWRSEAGLPLPADVEIGGDRLGAEDVWAVLVAGRHLLWRGDWVHARHLLQALTRRADRHFAAARGQPETLPGEAFARHRQRQGERAALLGRLLVPVNGNYKLPLRRAQDVRQACCEAWGEPDGAASLVSLRELLAVVSAHEWRKKGVPVPAVQGRIHPHYGVFSPVRGEYVDLVAQAPLPVDGTLAFDIGTGSGVLAAVLARRGVAHVVATDQDSRALACARENVERLGFAAQVEVIAADLFPAGRAPLVVCNPPWLPAQPSAPIEYAVYDPDSRMLRGFLSGLAAHLAPGGEGWLIISDLAEHLGLRSRQQLLDWIAVAGLVVRGRLDTTPRHGKASDRGDPLHAARAAEITSLWRLGAAPAVG
ncbi:MAG: class I SAM-dependent methyltransferase [Azonexus sp.]|jgi:methylase of polypeptide subunit release factors|uniref:class I SAM-dependent methyltransferase n=1 Tax=Azonexus sp. TaxID=1872668 RepID=UPI00282AC1B6|nr:class I SAM-dependent methyltransferase [Azonexus sp.]MDR0777217.1 class I SAM-dependent methyltransferase [Azonexus sp.]